METQLTEGQKRYRKYKATYARYRKNNPDYMKQYYETNKGDLEIANKKLRSQPWYKTYHHIRHRIVDRPEGVYKNVKNFLKINDIKNLWFRDKAYLMKRPSIDRIDPKGDYTLENCRYIEHSENARRAMIERWANRKLLK
jgi:hypothetical protein